MEKPVFVYQVPREPVWHNASTPATLLEQTHMPLPLARPFCTAQSNTGVIDCSRAYWLWFTYRCGESTNPLAVERQMILCFVFLSQLVASIVFISFGVIAAFCCAIVDGVFAARHIVSATGKHSSWNAFTLRKQVMMSAVLYQAASNPVNMYHLLSAALNHKL